MFNTSQTNIKMGRNTSNVTLNTPSHGMIQRSHPKSFFIRFSSGSPLEGFIFNSKGDQPSLIKKDKWGEKWEASDRVDVLQVMVFGDVQYLCEAVNIKDLIEDSVT